MGSEWIIGCCISVFSSTILNVGVNFQRWSLVSEEKDVESGRRTKLRPYIKQPKWWLGFSLFIVGNVGDMIALSFASPTILVALGSISLVSNSLLGILFLGEPFSYAILFDNVLIIFGAVLAILNGSHEDTSFTATDIRNRLESTEFLILATLYIAAFMGLYFLSRSIKKKHSEGLLTHKARILSPLVYCPMLGILATGTTIFGTSFSKMIRSAFDDDTESPFRSVILYAVIVLLVFCAVAQVHFLSKALSICGSLAVVPVQYSFWVILSMFASIVFFQNFEPKHLPMFVAGCVIVLVSVGLLSRDQYKLQVRKKTETQSTETGEPFILVDESESPEPVDPALVAASVAAPPVLLVERGESTARSSRASIDQDESDRTDKEDVVMISPGSDSPSSSSSEGGIGMDLASSDTSMNYSKEYSRVSSTSEHTEIIGGKDSRISSSGSFHSVSSNEAFDTAHDEDSQFDEFQTPKIPPSKLDKD